MGVTGVAQKVTIVPLQAIGDNGKYPDHSLETASTSSRAMAINYATNTWGHTDTTKRIKVLNYSISGFGSDRVVLSAAKNFPGLFVWSAGNDGKNVNKTATINTTMPGGIVMPINYNFDEANIISVGAIDKCGERSIWENGSQTMETE